VLTLIKKCGTLLDFACQLCTSDHANLCIVPILVRGTAKKKKKVILESEQHSAPVFSNGMATRYSVHFHNGIQ